MTATVLQVGEGRFLRAFLDVLVDDARRQGAFRGRLVVTAPRRSGAHGLEQLAAAGGRYRVVQRGPEGDSVREVAPFDRIVDGYADWTGLLAEVRADMPLVVVSNTTEAGLAYQRDDRELPATYPGRLTAWLAARARAGGAAPTAVVPCELVADNGRLLREAVLRHAADWGLDGEALVRGVPFADTLVDRIVTSEDPADPLACFTEPYMAWYIAGMPDWVRAALPLDGRFVHWVDDARPARDQKLRLLNGTHSLMAALGLQLGVATVLDALRHDALGPFVREALGVEAVGSFPDAGRDAARRFARDTLARFANPGIQHVLARIALQMSAKVRARWVPILEGYRREQGDWPVRFLVGLAAYLRLAVRPGDAGCDLAAVDDPAWIGRLRALWRPGDVAGFVAAAAREPGWPGPVGPGVVTAVAEHLGALERGVAAHVAAVGRKAAG